MRRDLFRTFTVEGRGDFPVDMLRYDECDYFGEDDMATATQPSPERPKVPARRVKLAIKEDSRKRIYGPTVARWESFGWRVVEVNGSPMPQPRAAGALDVTCPFCQQPPGRGCYGSDGLALHTSHGVRVEQAKLVEGLKAYDAVEVHPVHDNGECAEVIHDDTPPTYWSVYLHCVEGGVECIADCPSEENADIIAHALRVAYKLFR